MRLPFILIFCLLTGFAFAYEAGDVISADDLNSSFQAIKGELENRGVHTYSFDQLSSEEKISAQQLNQNFLNFKNIIPSTNLHVLVPYAPIKASEINDNFSSINLKINEIFNSRSCSVGNGSGEQSYNLSINDWNPCEATSCVGAFHVDSAQCIANIQPCSGDNGTGTKTWNGSSYNTCLLNNCVSSFHVENNLCLANVQSCSISNGAGTKTWSGTNYSSCSVSSCIETFHIEGNSCLSDIRSCFMQDGVGTQSWQVASQNYNSCSLVSCNSGFYPNMEGTACINTNSIACTNQSDAAGNIIGFGTYNYSGSAWSSCQITSCISGYSVSNGSCVFSGDDCLITATEANTGLIELQDILRNKGEVVTFSEFSSGSQVSPSVLNTNFNKFKTYDGAQNIIAYSTNELVSKTRWKLNHNEAKRIITDKLYYKNCAEIKYFEPTSVSNTYTVDVDGFSGSAAFQMYCDMNSLEGAGVVLKLSSTGFAFGSGNWTAASELNASSMLNNSYPSGYDAKNQGYYRLNRSYKIVLDTMRDGVVQEALPSVFNSQNSPQALMTTQSNSFVSYPSYASWKGVFGHDRSSSPVFDRNGSRQGRNIVGCGKSMVFGYQAHDSQNDVNSGLGQNVAYCGGGQNVGGGGGHNFSSSGRYSHGGGLVSGAASTPRVLVKEVSRVWALPTSCSDANTRKFRNQSGLISSGNFLIDADGANFGSAPSIQSCIF